jgi:hypothetical protein
MHLNQIIKSATVRFMKGKRMEETKVVREKLGFYWVWTKLGRRPRKAHPSYKSAKQEADRLALKNPGVKFLVLKVVEKNHTLASGATLA